MSVQENESIKNTQVETRAHYMISEEYKKREKNGLKDGDRGGEVRERVAPFDH